MFILIWPFLCDVPIGYAHLEVFCYFSHHSNLKSFQLFYAVDLKCLLGSSLYSVLCLVFVFFHLFLNVNPYLLDILVITT